MAAKASLSVGKTEACDDGILSLRDKGVEDGQASILKQFLNGSLDSVKISAVFM